MDTSSSSLPSKSSTTKIVDRVDPRTRTSNAGISVTTRVGGQKTKVASRIYAAGDEVDHFELVRKLGEGGFGQVWLADDTRLHRQVAIKLPHRSFETGSTEARRFFREAETAAKLTHPNLVPILDAVLQDRQSYIVSEYCPGPTLLQWMNDREDLPTPKSAISIIAQLASGLDVAHKLGLIHRDIKPSNILLADADSDHPIPRLTDFGLARAISEAPETRTGALIGSGPYMSPEQASGHIDAHGPHSDVHALGVLLYELLTSQSPFASNNEMDTLHRIISFDPPSISDVRPGISRDISAVCQRCLEKSPTRRYQDAGQLFADLQRVLDGRPPMARPVGRVGRLTRWASRNKAIASLAALLMLSCLAVVIGLAAYALESERNAAEDRFQAKKLQVALGIAEKQRSDAITQKAEAIKQRNSALDNYLRWQKISYTSDLSFAFLRFHQSHMGDVRRLLDRQIPKSGEIDLRTMEWWVLDRQLRQSYELWSSQGDGASDCRLIDDDATLITVGTNDEVVLWDTSTATPRRRLNDVGDQIASVAVLPNGSLVIPGTEWPLFGRCVHVIGATTGKVHEVLHSHPTTIDAIEVSDCGGVIASSSRYESIRCWFAKERRSVNIHNGLRNESFAMTPDGRRITTSQRGEQTLQVFDTRTGEIVQQADIGMRVLSTTGARQHPWTGFAAFTKPGFGLVNVDNLDDRVWIESPSVSRVLKFSSNDQYLAVSDRRGDLQLCELVVDVPEEDANNASRLPHVQTVARLAGLQVTINDLAVSQAGDIYTVSVDGALERFSPLQKNHIKDTRTLPVAFDAIVTVDGQTAWSVDHDGDVTRVAIDENSTENFFDCKSADCSERVMPLSRVGAICISEDQSRLAVLNRDRTLDIYKNQNDNGEFQPDFSQKRSLKIRPLDKSGSSCHVRLSRTGRYAAATADANTFEIFDLHSDSSDPICFRAYENDQRSLLFSPDERAFVCAGYNGVDFIDLSTGRTHFLNRPLTTVTSIAFHPTNGNVLVGNTDGSIQCLDAQSGEAIYHLHGMDSDSQHAKEIHDIVFYSDDRLAAVTQARELQFWDLGQQVQLGSIPIDEVDTSEGHFCRLQWLPNLQQLIVLAETNSNTKLFRWSIPEQTCSLR